MKLAKRHRQSRSQSPDVFGGLSQLRQELDQIFDAATSDLYSPFRAFGLLEREWSPSIDLSQDKDQIRVRAELPGLKRDEIELEVQGDTLILRGERKRDIKEKEGNYHRVEQTYGQFFRAISLPSSVDPNGIKATYKDGILEVVLPKKEEAKPKQINIDVK